MTYVDGGKFTIASTIWPERPNSPVWISPVRGCSAASVPAAAARPARQRSPLTVPAVARLVADCLAALDLHGVTLVGNDTATAIAQVVAARHAERVGRLVLVPIARAGLLTAALTPFRLPAARRLPMGSGWLTHGRPPTELTDEWVAAYFGDAGVRRDARKFTIGFRDRRLLLRVATELPTFTEPVLIAWAADDKFLSLRARRAAGPHPAGRPGGADRAEPNLGDARPAGPHRGTDRPLRPRGPGWARGDVTRSGAGRPTPVRRAGSPQAAGPPSARAVLAVRLGGGQPGRDAPA